MKSINEQIAELSAEERELFLLLLEQEGANIDDLIIPPRRESNQLPLSITQERLWTSGLFARDTAFGNLPLAFRVKGSLLAGAVQQSLSAIVRRHEILRTTFQTINGQTMQIVLPSWQPELNVTNLEGIPTEERFAEAVRQATAEAQRPFDFAREPSLRASLMQLTVDDHLLLIVLNHLVVDGWSIRVFLREFSAHYRHFAAGEAIELPALPIQYADYATWQRKWLQGDELKKQLSYWQEQLAGSPVKMDLPLDRPRPKRPSFKSAKQEFKWSPAFSKVLKEFCRDEGITLFVMLLAAWQTTLRSYTGKEDVIVGTTISNRSRSETENMIGNFGNNLLLRNNYADDPTFRILLQRLHETTMGAFAHQELPLEMLSEALRKTGKKQKVPLFQTFFIQRDGSLSENLNLGNLTVEFTAIEVQMSALELALDITDSNKGLYGSFEYLTAIFDDATISQMRSSFERVLETAVANPQLRNSDLHVLVTIPKKTEPDAPENGRYEGSLTIGEEQAEERKNGHASNLPQSELEKTMATIWQDVLELNYVGVYDNFFDLGARSLHVVEVHSRLHANLENEISIIDLFEYPTISALAQFVRSGQTDNANGDLQKQRADARRSSRARRRQSAR